jgi:hypothetical protein
MKSMKKIGMRSAEKNALTAVVEDDMSSMR